MKKNERDLYAAVLAAGKSTRMKSRTNKVLHDLLGKPVLAHALDTVWSLGPKKMFVVISPSTKEVEKTFRGKGVRFVVQDDPRGTGDAAMRLNAFFKRLSGDLVILPGDAPLLRRETARGALRFHRKHGAKATVITADHPKPGSYGRIVRSKEDELERIVEAKDADTKQKALREINSAMYIFDVDRLFSSLPKVRSDNKQKEYYLTDVIEILRAEGDRVLAFKIDDWQEIMGINTREELARAHRILGDQLKRKWMDSGVTFVNPDTVHLEHNVKIGADTVIYPFVSLLGKTVIGKNVIIGPGLVLKNVRIKDGEHIE
jgi:bifunctional UDP-N-acetylglucosamine pyrophosphorylase/glucosamine-1-phosphate N-acetyltransferase